MAGVFRRARWHGYFTRRTIALTAAAAVNLSFTAQQGVVHVTGQNASINASRVVTAQQGVVHATGQNASINASRVVTAQQGVIHATGQHSSINASRVVTAQQGVVHVTGQNTSIAFGADLAFTAQQGVVHATGQNASINASRSVTAQQGVVHVTGQNPTVILGGELAFTAQQGLVYITGQNATITAGNVTTTGIAQVYALSDLDYFINETTTDISVFVDLNMGFAESVFLGATEMSGIFDDHSVAGGERVGPLARMKTSDIDDNSIAQGTQLSIRSRAFFVRGVQRDGTGISVVVLEETT